MPNVKTTVITVGRTLSLHTHKCMHLIHFLYEIFLIWTKFCPTLIDYFDKTLNVIANSSCMPCPEVQLDITLKHIVSLYKGCVVF